MLRLQVRYTGRVQGVGFRATVQAIARRSPAITGWVRNEPDGSVLMEAQGPDEHTLASFREAIRARMNTNITAEHALPATAVDGEAEFRIAR